MSPHEVRDGMHVVITAERRILGQSWHGTHGVVRYTFRRQSGVPDWVTVQVPDDGFVLIGFRPDEVEPA